VTERPWGPDVSHYQGNVDWRKVKASGASFAFVKATEGETGVDSALAHNWPAIYKAGILVRGAYHYAHIEGDPKLQAAHFVKTLNSVGHVGRGDFLILDAEDVCSKSQKIGKAATSAWVMTWLNEVVRLTGFPRKRVLVYTGSWWWGPRTGNYEGPERAGHPLWLSAYIPEGKLDYSPWRIWRFWQFSSKAHVAGVEGNCDKSVFNGSARGLWWLSGRPLRLFGKKA